MVFKWPNLTSHLWMQEVNLSLSRWVQCNLPCMLKGWTRLLVSYHHLHVSLAAFKPIAWLLTQQGQIHLLVKQSRACSEVDCNNQSSCHRASKCSFTIMWPAAIIYYVSCQQEPRQLQYTRTLSAIAHNHPSQPLVHCSLKWIIIVGQHIFSCAHPFPVSDNMSHATPSEPWHLNDRKGASWRNCFAF